jgi:hypothetical protein
LAASIFQKQKRPKTKPSFSFRINRAKFRDTYRREGRYLVRSNLSEQAPATLWEYYTQLTEVEEAFKNLKGDLGIRPIFHQLTPPSVACGSPNTMP